MVDILAYRRIGTPEEAHGVASAAGYLALMRETRARGEFMFPSRPWPVERDVFGSVAFVSGGRWVVPCECRNAPSAHPAWKLAACLSCFAVHRDVIFPDDIKDVEGLLMARPHMQNRNWFPWCESVSDLIVENIMHGAPSAV